MGVLLSFPFHIHTHAGDNKRYLDDGRDVVVTGWLVVRQEAGRFISCLSVRVSRLYIFVIVQPRVSPINCLSFVKLWAEN